MLIFNRARATLAPASGGVTLNVGGLVNAGHNNTGGYTCIHARNAANEMTSAISPSSTTPVAANANHGDHRIFSPQSRYSDHSVSSKPLRIILD